MPQQQRRALVGNTILVLCSVIFSLIIVEIALRIVGFTHLSVWRFDNITGKALLENAQMWNDAEGHAFVQINSDGMRDVEHSLEKPDNTLRVAVLGDSYAEAIQVPLEQTFAKIMEQALLTCPKLQNKKVEVLNFGVGGFGTVQELLTLNTKVWKYSPDIVVLAFLTGNDVRNNLRELQQGKNQPYYIYDNGKLVLDDSFLDRSKSRLLGGFLGQWWFASLPHSRLLQLFARIGDITNEWKNNDAREARQSAQRAYERGLDDEVYREPSDPAWQAAWQVTEALVRQMNSEVKANNADFLLVTLSNGIQVNPDATQRTAYANELGIPDLMYPDERMLHFAQREKIDVLTLVPPLLTWAAQNNTCVHGFDNAETCGGHWNADGHRIAGTAIAERICASGPR